MNIRDLYKSKQVLSMEVFPPKGELHNSDISKIINELLFTKPDYISVTFSAGGNGNSEKSCQIASAIKNQFHIEALAHLTCINSTIDEINHHITQLKNANITNILALRGDKKEGCLGDFNSSIDLIRMLKDKFCIGGACYPEGHLSCHSIESDLAFLLKKQEAGADFFISQLFFDNAYFYQFLDKARQLGISVPISAGIMPILSSDQIKRMIFMCGASLPSAIIRILNRYENDPVSLRLAGIDYAGEQIFDLLNSGVDGVHLYTMNRPEIAIKELEYITNNGYIRH